MAFGIPVSDLLAICLIFAEYDQEVSIGEMLRRAFFYQQTNNSVFGEGESDFATLLHEFAVIKGNISYRERDQSIQDFYNTGSFSPIFYETRIADWILPMLEYGRVYSNDEGESWDHPRARGFHNCTTKSLDRMERQRHEYDDDLISAGIKFNLKMRYFFQTHQNPSPEEIASLFDGIPYVSGILKARFRGEVRKNGSSSFQVGS
ncbi:MAG TPA: hypothetical protein VN372_00895 [Methanospirillum sp.]|nr:hypothetical protein [Methanospirillum sp.]